MTKQKINIAVAFLFVISFVKSQTNWELFDSATTNNPRILYYDSTDSSLYVGGYFYRFNTNDTIISIGKYKKGTWSAMGIGMDMFKSDPWSPSNIGGMVNDIIRYHDTLYVTGEFSHTDTIPLKGLAWWDGTAWQQVGTGLTGVGHKFKIINSELYLAGTFASVNGVPANSLAKYDGNAWSAVHNLPPFWPSGGNTIYDMEEYNGELYIGGVLYDNNIFWGSAKWNGSAWVPTGLNVLGQGYLRCLFKYKNELYAAGMWSVYDHPGNTGNAIAKYDGTSWKPVLDNGLLNDSFLMGHVRTYKEYQGDLYIGGIFNNVNGVFITQDIIKFDGTNWCSVDTTFDGVNQIDAIEFFGDTLLMAGTITFNSKGIHSIASCPDYHHTDTCMTAVTSISENQNNDYGILVYPSPSSASFSIQLDRTLKIESVSIRDIQGKCIFKKEIKKETDFVELELNEADGIYFLEIETENGVLRKKILVQ
jgi:hypothetical protein